VIKIPKQSECAECHKINPWLKDCNPFETDEYYSDDYCLFNVDDDCYTDEDWEDLE
jgi:hypothetical protein